MCCLHPPLYTGNSANSILNDLEEPFLYLKFHTRAQSENFP